MAKGRPATKLGKAFTDFIAAQPMFFVATAAADGRVNVSPKGLDSLRVVSPTQIVWLSVSGSGNETAAHVQAQPRMTLMFCGFEGKPLILRVYGTASVVYPRHDAWAPLCALFPDYPGARSIFTLDIDSVAASCGTGVPEMAFVRSRAETELVPWYAEMGEDGVEAYWRKKNMRSIDGYPTGIFEDPP
jgi:hypothetical protein